ncbi:MAG: SUMF1/EgtB/PvdO family nonheme iron enzyme [Acidobacteria bacterium]|nr:SUMF1/EgtB/PvdO family nonheme iron enzyme [Acidobacteriota bacterium]
MSATVTPVVVAPAVRPVPSGCFLMGSAGGRPDQAPARAVRVYGFDLAVTPVTNAQYAPLVAAGHAPAPPWWSHPAFSCGDQPVVGVTWFEAVAFAEWLSDAAGGRWRLPTEAEWEHAARGGLHGAKTAWGEALPENEVPGGSLDGPWPVGRGTPNGFGLCDMGTIVHEWCADWYREDYYRIAPADDPKGPEEGERRSSRGGSWRHHVRWSTPAARSSLPPGFRYADYGFRVLRERP